jgi:DNA 3'-phosphatase
MKIDTQIARATTMATPATTQATADPAPAAGLARQQLAASYQRPGPGAIKVAFVDADSTLRVSLSGSVSANGPKDVALLPNVGPSLKQLVDEGYLIAIVSNQAGVEQGHVTLQDADAALQYTVELVRQAGGEVHWVDFAEAKDDRRKPDIGMARDLEAFLVDKFGPDAKIDKGTSVMIGDSAYKKGEPRPDGTPGTHFSNSDRLFAEKLGVPFREPADAFGWRALGVDGFEDIKALDAHRAAHESGARTAIGAAPPRTTTTSLQPSTSSALHVRLGAVKVTP